MHMRKLKLIALIATLALMAIPRAVGQGSQQDATTEAKSDPVFKVLQYADMAGTSDVVVIDGGSKQGLKAGATLKTYRHSKESLTKDGSDEAVWIETGRLKALQVQDTKTVCAIVTHGSTLSNAFFPKFPGIMTGDAVMEESFSIIPMPVVNANTALPYSELFEDPRSNPETYEISASGRDHLKVIGEQLSGSRMGMLMVEGYTDTRGPADINQIESYQRALTIRTYLVNELGFVNARVMAVGYGESEQIGEGYSPSAEQDNRRIVLRLVNKR